MENKNFVKQFKLLGKTAEVIYPYYLTRTEKYLIGALGFYDTLFTSYENLMGVDEEFTEEFMGVNMVEISDAASVLYKSWKCLLGDVNLCEKDLKSIIFALSYYINDLRSVEEFDEAYLIEGFISKAQKVLDKM